MTPGVGSGESGDASPDADDVVRRLDQLSMRVEALGGLVESLFDRVEQSVWATAPLTAEEMADVAARLVRLIEARLESHSARLEQMVSTLAEPSSGADVDSEVAELRAAIDQIPNRVAMEQPAARLDAMIIERINTKLTESVESASEKVEQLLELRVQRFETLTQSMMTLVGDPVDSLNEKLNRVIARLDTLDEAKRTAAPE